MRADSAGTAMEITGGGRVRVKICGITGPGDARMAESAGADAIGVVVHSESRRNVTPDRATRIFAALGPFPARVCVTHTRDPALLEEILAVRPTAIQVDGDCPLPARHDGVKVIRSVAPGDPVPEDCDAVLVDGSHGAGRPFAAEFARGVRAASPVPVFLAGGLTPENVVSAVEAVGPAAVDVATGVEVRPGVKDPRRVAAFIEAVRNL